MCTSLCDVTVTLKRQRKIVNIFFLKQDTFFYKKCMFDTFTKKYPRNYTAAYTKTSSFLVIIWYSYIFTSYYRRTAWLRECKRLLFGMLFNTYTTSVLFVGHWQTVQTQTRRRKMRHLIRVSTFCSNNILSKFE